MRYQHFLLTSSVASRINIFCWRECPIGEAWDDETSARRTAVFYRRLRCANHYGQDEAALVRLWQEKRGEVEPQDLSGNLIVQLGVVTEGLNRRWFEANTGFAVKDVQRRAHHPVLKWMAATLDGVVETSGAVFESKFMLPWSFSEEMPLRSAWPSCSTTCG